MDSLQQYPQAEIVGIVDAYKGRLERALGRTKGRARIYPTYHDLLAEKSIDAVVVATPDHLHKTIVVDSLRAGKDVYCEKPLTYRISDGPEIIAAARAGERIVQVGSQGVSSDLERRAKAMIRAGRLGRITMIHAAINRNTASGAWIYPIPPDASPKTVNWEMFLGPASRRPFSLERFFRWRCYQEYSGGISTDLFVHLLTAIHFLMDARMPARVMAMGELYRWKDTRDVPDTLNAIMEYPEGFHGQPQLVIQQRDGCRKPIPNPGHRRQPDHRRRGSRLPSRKCGRGQPLDRGRLGAAARRRLL